jgi:hypothetical protein
MSTTQDTTDRSIHVEISSTAVEQAHQAITEIIRGGGLDPRDYWTVAAHMIEVLAIATALLGGGKDRDLVIDVLQQLIQARIVDLTDPRTVVIRAPDMLPAGSA